MTTKTMSGVTVKDAAKGVVSAVFSTFGTLEDALAGKDVVDKDADITLPGAIKDGMEVVISAYQHQSHYGALPVGKGTIRTTSTEAVLDGRFFLNTAAGRDTFEVVKELGPLQEWSYSLHNVVRKSAEVNGRPVSVIEEIGLIKEVSPVLIGAGVQTRTLLAKGHTSLHDQIAAAMGVVDGVIDSAERVVALRAEQGKSLSQVNVTSLDGLAHRLDRLKALLTEEPAPADLAITEELDAAVKAAAAAYRRTSLFSNLIQKEQHP